MSLRESAPRFAHVLAPIATNVALTTLQAVWHDGRPPVPLSRNARPTDRAARPTRTHEDLHGHRARRQADPDDPPRPPARAVRARAQAHAGRHRLELPGLGRGHDLRRSRRGRSRLGHGRQRVRRPAHGLRAGHPRPRRRARRRLRQRADAPGRQLQPDERGRGPRGRAHLRADRLGRHGAHDRVGHRGHDARDARRPGLHRPREDREVRGPVPRRPRLRADQRRAGRHVGARRRGRAGRAGLGSRHPGRGRGHDHPGPLQPHRVPAHSSSSAQGDEIAAIIVEPVLGNAQGIMPQAGLPQGDARPHRGVRDPADLRRGQDRLPLRASGGAAEFFGITPDLATYAKAMGNGYPAAAFGGRREVMERPARQGQPRRHVRRQPGRGGGRGQDARASSGTRTPSRPSTRPGGRIQDGLKEILNPIGIPYHFTGHPSMFGIMFREEEATEYRDWATTDHELYDAIAIGMHARGAMPEPDSREPWFICEAHADGRHHRPGRSPRSPTRSTPRSRTAHIARPAPTPHGGMASPGAG